jgi:hypothetical protein
MKKGLYASSDVHFYSWHRPATVVKMAILTNFKFNVIEHYLELDLD